MKDKITVKICIGTYSYVMGGADLINIEKYIPGHLLSAVNVSGTIEIPGIDEKKLKPPYASVNNQLITEATEAKIVKAIETEMSAVK